MALPADKDALSKGTSELYLSERYSDFKFVCNGQTYPVHKAIICPRSKYFANAVDFGKEAAEGQIVFPREEHEEVKAMLQYFYLLDYQLDSSDKPTYLLPIFDRKDDSWSKDACRLRRDLFSDLAYTTKDGMWTAINVAESLGGKLTTRDNIYTLQFQEAASFERIHAAVKTLLASEKNKNAPRWQDVNYVMAPMIHARVYALAEKYTIESLKRLAMTKFSALHGQVFNEGFYEAVDIIFTSTPDSDMGLRDIVVRKLCFIINQYGVLSQIKNKLNMFPELVVQIINFQAGFHNLPPSYDLYDDF